MMISPKNFNQNPKTMYIFLLLGKKIEVAKIIESIYVHGMTLVRIRLLNSKRSFRMPKEKLLRLIEEKAASCAPGKSISSL